MFARIFTTLALLLLATSAQAADDYGHCAGEINAAGHKLIAPVKPVVSVMEISKEISVLLIAGPEEFDLGDSVIPVSSEYQSGLHGALKNLPAPAAWIGVIEEEARSGQPALWLHVWLDTPAGCVDSFVDNRVYDERGNAPTIFWRDVVRWEHQHPESVLVRAK